MSYCSLVLSGAYRETAPVSGPLSGGISARKGFRFDTFLCTVERVIADARIDRVLVDCRDDFGIGFAAGAEAVRSQLARLSAAGKTLWFCAKDYRLVQLYLASACAQRVIHPVGILECLGMARTFFFVKQLLDRHKIKVSVIRVGRYKSAGDIFRVDDLDAYNREQYRAVNDACVNEFRRGIIAGCGLPEPELDALFGGRVLVADEAVEAGWMHRAAVPADLIGEWEKGKIRERRFGRAPKHFGRGPGIAVLVFEGGIRDGENSPDPLSGQMIGSDTYCEQIEKLRKDTRVKAVVFRVNSGGGSATASEDISRAMARLAADKPVAVSMSEVAGSGGYWISLGLGPIFVHRTTVTGSIGIISMLFHMAEFLRGTGITGSVIRNGEFSDAESIFREPSERDFALVESVMRRLYGKFIGKVAECRGMSPERVDELGEGHVFAGVEAVRLGLADEIGGIPEAVDYLRGRIGARTARVVFRPKPRRSLLSVVLGAGRAAAIDAALCGGIGTGLVPETLVPRMIASSFLAEYAGKPLLLSGLGRWW